MQLVVVVVQVRPPGLAVTVYPVIVAPPSDDGGDHVTVATLSPGIADTPATTRASPPCSSTCA